MISGGCSLIRYTTTRIAWKITSDLRFLRQDWPYGMHRGLMLLYKLFLTPLGTNRGRCMDLGRSAALTMNYRLIPSEMPYGTIGAHTIHPRDGSRLLNTAVLENPEMKLIFLLASPGRKYKGFWLE